ncbi:hypothetical protein AVEN_275755-1 [Araneus ventricosus]|uniref:CRAL/TRIO N-terminal domain-containing protein n=1 Tax=Araneus ventricosus TaxID=182803 RepID=A0A4Y2HNM5_ARAVE|nr:hypothetical protein AVEN_275755-1 [Araneus ventricosus]
MHNSVFASFPARDFNVSQAESMLRKHIAWRKEFQIDTILSLYKPPEVLVKYAPTCFLCFTKDGCLARYVDCGGADLKGSSGFLQPTPAHNQNRPTSTSGLNEKCRSSVDSTQDFSPQSLVVITQLKRALARFLSSSKILSFFLTLISLPLGERSKSHSTNSRQFCRWSLFQRAIIGSLPLSPFPVASGFLGWS